MTDYNIRIYDLSRLTLLWVAAFTVLPVIIVLPGLMLAQSAGVITLLLIAALVAGIWCFRNVCSSVAVWKIEPEGMSVSLRRKNNYFAFPDRFIRWDDITGYDETSRYFGGSDRYIALQIFTYSGNDPLLHSYYYNNEFRSFLDQFRSCVVEKSPYFTAGATGMTVQAD